jgi:hypothetical protein
MMNFYARTREGAPRDHCSRCISILSRWLRRRGGLPWRPPDDKEFAQAAFTAGLLHDLGKYTDEFQAYLKGERERRGGHKACPLKQEELA